MFLVSGAASSDLTGPKCIANTVHWTYDTWMLANGTGKAMVKRRRQLVLPHRRLRLRPRARARHRAVVKENGGKVLGEVRHPLNTTDFSSFLLQAQAPRPRSSASPMPAATPSTRSSRRAEFGIVKGGQNLAGLLVFVTDVHALGLQTAQGLISPRPATGT